MRLTVAVGLGAIASACGWMVAQPIFERPLFASRNYRDATVPVGAGVVLAIAVVATDAVFVVFDQITDRAPTGDGATALVLVTVLGFCLLGLVDDLAGDAGDRGFRGHLRALRDGRLSTGGLKLIGGGLLGLVISGAVRSDGVGPLVVDALLIALAANVGNLFDRAPGRTIKVGGLALLAVLLVASTADRSQLAGVAMVLGASLGLLLLDVREYVMLGDAGSNAIGATVGVGVVLSCGLPVRVAVLVVALALNVISERVSFSRVIDAVAPLRFLDRLGRR